MRKVVALLVGLCIAILLGWLYIKFSGPLVYKEPVPVPAAAAVSSGSNMILFAIVIFSWVTAFMSLPVWLSIALDLVIGWLGCALFIVLGVFVWLAQPNNTLQDPTYVGFLCCIAMVASRLVRILRTKV